MKTTTKATKQQVLAVFQITGNDVDGFFWKDIDSRTSIVFATYAEAYASAKQDFLIDFNFYNNQE